MNTLLRTLLLLCAASSAIVLSGCGMNATIKYSQLANCWEYNTYDNGSTSGDAGDGLFMLYRINSIETSSGTFYFYPDRLYVGDKSNTSGNGGVNTLIANHPTNKTIPAGSKITGVGKLFFQVPLSGDLSSQKHTAKPLQYKHPNFHTVTLIKEGKPDPDFLTPCTAAWVNGYSNTYP